MTTYVLNILLFPGLIFSIFIGLLFKGIDRKIVAFMQRRKGPSIIQPFYDTVKLFNKETIIPKNSTKFIFKYAPLISLAASITILLFIPITEKSVFTNIGDIVVILYLLTIPALMNIMAASNSGSLFSAIGMSREIVLLLSCEIPIAISLITVGIFVGKETGGNIILSLSEITKYQINTGSLLFNLKLLPVILAFLLTLPGEIGKIPFDLAEAETEICEGIYAEYGGKNLGIFHLAQYVKSFALIGIFVSLFMGGLFVIEGSYFLNTLSFLVKSLFILIIFISWLSASVARIKIEQAVKYFWIFPFGLSLLGLLIVWFL